METSIDPSMEDWLWLMVVLIGAVYAAAWLVFRAYFKSKLAFHRTVIKDLEGDVHDVKNKR